MKINRRELLSLGAKATMALTAGRFFVTESRAAETHPATEDTKFKNAFITTDGFVEQYMREMNSPGMILVLSDRTGISSFMSALQIDIDEGVGAFASINAQQGYRPNPVAMYALKTMRAANANQPMPARPTANPLTRIEKAADYAGVFTAPDGRKLEFTSAAGDALFVLYKGKRLQLETTAGEPIFSRSIRASY